MADLFQDTVSWLDGVRNESLSQTVVYHRGAEARTMTATMVSTSYEVIADSAAALRAHSPDFLITASSLVFGVDDTKGDPEIGDRIVVTISGSEVTFEVLALEGLEHFIQDDPYGTVLRIHTKHIDGDF